MKPAANTSPPVCMSVTRPIEGTLPSISHLSCLSVFIQTFISEPVSVASSSVIVHTELDVTTMVSEKGVTAKESVPSGGSGKFVLLEPFPSPHTLLFKEKLETFVPSWNLTRGNNIDTPFSAREFVVEAVPDAD
jgi:hypothetical protein